MLTKGQITAIRIGMYDSVESLNVSRVCRQAIQAIELQERIDQAIEYCKQLEATEGCSATKIVAIGILNILQGKTSTQNMLNEVIEHIMEV